MPQNRRKFLQTTGLLAAGSLLAGNELFAETQGKKLKHFGIQLWTLRDVIAAAPKATLKDLASYGYTQIESFEGAQGIFWGIDHKDFKKYMVDMCMTIISSHCDIDKNFEKKAEAAGSIGMKYLICPWKGPQKSIDDFKRIADDFNKKGEICKKNGLRFAYHNHGYSFKELNGQMPQDVMMQNTDPNLVDFEMDIYWVVTGGADPIKYLQKYGDRFRLCHVKDRMKDAKSDDASCVVGEGSIDFKSILKVAKKNGVRYFIIEQERYDNTTPMKAAEADAKYMKTLMI